jgi:hypothetical protein
MNKYFSLVEPLQAGTGGAPLNFSLKNFELKINFPLDS